MVKVNEYAELKASYPYINAWGQMMGSFAYYIIEQMRRAKKDKAPANATYYSDTNKRWNTTDDINSDETKYQLQKYIDE